MYLYVFKLICILKTMGFTGYSYFILHLSLKPNPQTEDPNPARIYSPCCTSTSVR